MTLASITSTQWCCWTVFIVVIRVCIELAGSHTINISRHTHKHHKMEYIKNEKHGKSFLRLIKQYLKTFSFLSVAYVKCLWCRCRRMHHVEWKCLNDVSQWTCACSVCKIVKQKHDAWDLNSKMFKIQPLSHVSFGFILCFLVLVVSLFLFCFST